MLLYLFTCETSLKFQFDVNLQQGLLLTMLTPFCTITTTIVVFICVLMCNKFVKAIHTTDNYFNHWSSRSERVGDLKFVN